ncbi:MAG TPA: COX15/CtaA family protein [Acidimicrobiia bacterium]|nr:COX15/CtaA family protein [Acidimicrobiia bacterium]
MRVLHLSPVQYRRVTVVAAFLLAAIIVTGSAVRLTGSGLGCPDWPNCEPGRLTPYAANDFHAMVEFVNRMVTGLVSLAVIVAVLGSIIRTPRRRDLVLLSLGLVAGVIVQIVLGKLVVEKLLSPPWVMSHFLVSMLLLANALVLCRRAGQPDDAFAQRPVPIAATPVVWMSRVLLAAAAVVVVTGTVVTGSGPHSGDVPGTNQRATRLDLYIPDVARVHGTAAMVLLALVLVTLVLAYRTRAPQAVLRRLSVLLAVLVAQAGVGYAQYFTGIPALLVGIHVGGATALWAATVWFALGVTERRAAETVADVTPAPVLAGAGEQLR